MEAIIQEHNCITINRDCLGGGVWKCRNHFDNPHSANEFTLVTRGKKYTEVVTVINTMDKAYYYANHQMLFSPDGNAIKDFCGIECNVRFVDILVAFGCDRSSADSPDLPPKTDLKDKSGLVQNGGRQNAKETI